MAKQRLAALFLCLAGSVTAQQPASTASGPVQYTVRATTVDADERGRIPVEVTMRWRHSGGTRAVLQMPHWTPGSYRLRDFPERVDVLSARCETGRDPLEVSVREVTEGRFDLQPLSPSEVVVETRVWLLEADRFMHPGPGRTALTYEGPQMYLYIEGEKDRPCEVTFDLPEGWEAASGLHPNDDGTFRADDYDFLADCPVKLGTFRRWSFETNGTPIDVVMDGADTATFDDKGWIANIQRITEVQSAIFGGLPFDHYTFLFTASRIGKGGGLEHLTSTAIGAQTGGLGPRARISTIAHEFFHAWNVKRARPIELGPFDYTRPNRTTMLWLCEGLTSYFTDITLARMGQVDLDGFWTRMGRQIQSLESNPARYEMSSGDASYTVWDDRPVYGAISYYNSGEVLGLLLDVQIRAATDNRKSLDDAMVSLFEFCTREDRGFTEAEVRATVNEISGTDLGWFFDAHVNGILIPDYAKLLAPAGIEVTTEERSRVVLDGVSTLTGENGRLPYWSDPENPRIARQRAGVVIAVDGEEVDDPDELRTLIADKEPESQVTLTIRRADGTNVEASPTLRTERGLRVRLTLSEEPDDLAKRIRASMIAAPEGR
ncbi:MAG: hypothetical protein AAF196_06300 [Planctomycetota bacterium]